MATQCYGHTTLRPYNFKAIRRYGHTTLRPYNVMAIQSFGHTTLWPHNVTALRRYGHTTLRPHNVTAIKRYDHTTYILPLISNFHLGCLRSSFLLFYWRAIHIQKISSQIILRNFTILYVVHSPTNTLFINLVKSFKSTIISLLHASVFNDHHQGALSVPN